MMLIALDKAQGCFRSPGARSIIWKISWRIIVPGFENRSGRLTPYRRVTTLAFALLRYSVAI